METMTTATKFCRLFVLLVTAIFLFPCNSIASVFMAVDGNVVTRGELIEDDLYLFGNYSEVLGDVDGDVSAFVYSFSSSGTIHGNVNLFAYDSDSRGRIDRSVRLFTSSGVVDAHIERNLILFGNILKVERHAFIGRDLTCAGERVIMAGTVGGNTKLSGNSVVVKGVIEGNLEIESGNINILNPAIIKGDFIYKSHAEADIDDGVVIDGEVIWNEPDVAATDDDGDSTFSIITSFILFLLCLTTGLVLIIFFKRHTLESSNEIFKKPAQTFAVGLLSFAVFIIGSIVMFVLIVGIPVSILLVSLGIALFYVGKIYSSIVLGRLVFKPLREGRMPLGIELLAGLIILSLTFQIPYFGWVIYLLTAILGMGAAIAGFLAINRKLNEVYAPASDTPPMGK